MPVKTGLPQKCIARLSEEDYASLHRLAEASQCTRSEVIRALLQKASARLGGGRAQGKALDVAFGQEG